MLSLGSSAAPLLPSERDFVPTGNYLRPTIATLEPGIEGSQRFRITLTGAENHNLMARDRRIPTISHHPYRGRQSQLDGQGLLDPYD